MASKKNEKELKMNEKTNAKETTEITEKNAEQSEGEITDTILNTTTETILDYEEVPEIENRNEEGQEKRKEEEQETQSKTNPKGRTKRQRDLKKENAKIKIELYEERNSNQNLRHSLQDIKDQLLTKTRVIKEMDRQLAEFHEEKNRKAENNPTNANLKELEKEIQKLKTEIKESKAEKARTVKENHELRKRNNILNENSQIQDETKELTARINELSQQINEYEAKCEKQEKELEENQETIDILMSMVQENDELDFNTPTKKREEEPPSIRRTLIGDSNGDRLQQHLENTHYIEGMTTVKILENIEENKEKIRITTDQLVIMAITNEYRANTPSKDTTDSIIDRIETIAEKLREINEHAEIIIMGPPPITQTIQTKIDTMRINKRITESERLKQVSELKHIILPKNMEMCDDLYHIAEQGLQRLAEGMEERRRKTHPDEQELTILIDEPFLKHVIGKGGQNIRDTEGEFNVEISLGPENRDGSKQMTIKGTKDETERCAERIKIRLAKLPETLQREQETNELRRRTRCRNEQRDGYCQYGNRCFYKHITTNQSTPIRPILRRSNDPMPQQQKRQRFDEYEDNEDYENHGWHQQ